jgi:hypothetical protein
MRAKNISPMYMLAALERIKRNDDFQKTMLKTLRRRLNSGCLTDADITWIRSTYMLELQSISHKKTK